jgi:hypothetical protein
VLAAARARPDTLTIGLDANAAGMIRNSRRAPANALYAVAAAEHPP